MLCAYHDITEVAKIVKQIVHDECLLLSVVYDWFIIFIIRERDCGGGVGRSSC